MQEIRRLLDANRNWAERISQRRPGFFEELAEGQKPRYLWIGCSDSRVPANDIIELPPGELFVHRNVANLVVHTDMNCMSVLQFAVEVLGIRYVIVCGHYGCGGVRAALDDEPLGLIDGWLERIRDLRRRRWGELAALADEQARVDRLAELNVVEQVASVARTSVIRGAWRRGQTVYVLGWIYGLRDGLLKDLDVCVGSPGELETLERTGSGAPLPEDAGPDP